MKRPDDIDSRDAGRGDVGPGGREVVEPRVIKNDRKSLVERIETPEGKTAARKTYWIHPALVWRTFHQRSRAQREYENLAALVRAGVPSIEPISYSEERRLGFTSRSTIVTAWIGRSKDLWAVLTTRDRTKPKGRERRLWLMREYGRLMRALHDHGFLSTTSYPRNVVIARNGTGSRLLFCDQPRMVCFRGSLVHKRRADIDLFDIAFSTHRTAKISRRERYEFLLAYANGERDWVRSAWRRLAGRSRWFNQVVKRACHALYHVPFSSFQARRPTSPGAA